MLAVKMEFFCFLGSDCIRKATPVMPMYTVELHVWLPCLASSRLLLSSTKTKFIWLGSRRRLENADRTDRYLVAETFPDLVFCDTVRDLGIILDFWWQTFSSSCKHLDYAAPCILSCPNGILPYF